MSVGSAEPNSEERNGGAGRVELWRCTACGRVNRYPRLNDLRALFVTRRGRCGEAANLFMLCLRAVGLRARYVWCAEDHVWCEVRTESRSPVHTRLSTTRASSSQYWSPGKDRWVHVDPSEGKTDRPLLYALGWQKRFTYILAFGTSGARDVTLSYVPSLDLPAGRVSIGERDLRRWLKWITGRRRAGLGEKERAERRREDASERRWESDWLGRVSEEEERAMREGREGRVSGGAAWREARGEAVGGAQSGFVLVKGVWFLGDLYVKPS